ncbi:MAG: hypothetical protein JKY48_15770 [Flavobacteriales bacterium]|nr:hypothetical protein [Flavobacteriales bacterium]
MKSTANEMKLTAHVVMSVSIFGKEVEIKAEMAKNQAPRGATNAEKSAHYGGLMYSGIKKNIGLNFKEAGKNLVEALGVEAGVIDHFPAIKIEELYVSYNGKTKNINVIGLANVAGKELRFFFKSENGKHAFGLLTDLSGFTGLPMVGEHLKDLKLTDVGFIYMSDNAPKFIIPKLSDKQEHGNVEDRQLNPSGVPIFTKNLTKGFNLVGDFFLPSWAQPIDLSLPTQSKSKTTSTAIQQKTTAAINIVAKKTATPSFDPSVKWFKLKKVKKVGPASISGLGFSYKNNEIALLISGSLSLGGLTVSLEGLGAGFNFSKILKAQFELPRVFINGLGLAFEKPPIEISGSFLKGQTHALDKAGNPIIGSNNKPTFVPIYSGGAVLKAEDFTLSALGSYSTVNHEPSMFIFALYEGALGGPPFFLVEGLAAGFGYNRRVKIPAIDEVEDFPFVQLAISPSGQPTDPLQILPKLNDSIIPSPGDYWFAIGVKFNSFKLIDSFALLIASFGRSVDFRLDILGISTLVFPVQEVPEGESSPPIIAKVRMALKATYIPSEGILGIKAQLIEGSYVLSEDCVLTGGFAFYSWFEGSGHSGDFVQTMGGYHPDFVKPPHYPDVPRLAFNWKVSKKVSLKGEMYYAMTPSMCMAGGSLKATYKDGSIHASFTIGADFLISWEPFFYDAKFHVSIAASYKKDCGLFDLKFSVHVGAQVHIWGPDMRGTASIDLDICTIKVAFGSTSPVIKAPILWDKFQTSFLPPASERTKVLVNNGLKKTIGKGATERWIINPKDFVISTDSVIPLKEITAAKTSSFSNVPHFGIAPMEKTYGDITSSQVITIKKAMVTVNDHFKFEMIHKNLPKALWQNRIDLSNYSPLENADATIVDMLVGLKITPAHPPVAGTSKAIERTELSVNLDRNPKVFNIELSRSKLVVRINETTDDLIKTIDNLKDYPNVIIKRNALMKSLLFDVSSDFDLQGLHDDCFMDDPMFIS